MADQQGEVWRSAADWEVLYRQYFSRIARYCARSVGDATDAEDLTQQIFIELTRTEIPEKPLPYLQAIARNILAQYRRRKLAEQAALARYLRDKQLPARETKRQEVTEDPPQGDSKEGVERILMTLVRQLSPQDAELVTLRFVEGLSIKEVAQRLGCSPGAVRKRIGRLRTVLRRLYQGSDEAATIRSGKKAENSFRA